MPLSVLPRPAIGTETWRDTATNWITLDGFTDDASSTIVSNAVVTASVHAVDSLMSIDPVTLTAVIGTPGSYETYITSDVFRVDSAVRLDVRAVYGDSKVALFSKTLRVVP